MQSGPFWEPLDLGSIMLEKARVSG